jgi:DNA modification methylase
MTPYYAGGGITVYHAKCEDVPRELLKCDLLLTDPPYGIGQDKGAMGEGGSSAFGKKCQRIACRSYEDRWDGERPSAELLRFVIARTRWQIIWGGNYFADILPENQKWLVWDKQQTMPSFSDAEIAWTNLDGTSTKMFRQCSAGLMAVERDRWHPTQKPLALMKWCLTLCLDVRSVLDPFAGSGTTLVAAKAFGLRAVGVEREEKYCELIATRLGQEVLEFAE